MTADEPSPAAISTPRSATVPLGVAAGADDDNNDAFAAAPVAPFGAALWSAASASSALAEMFASGMSVGWMKSRPPHWKTEPSRVRHSV